MKKCKDIKNSLPLYLDDSLSGVDKQSVEEHLKTCPQCTKFLTQLSKTQTLVNSLGEVNPPPWLKQKIMAGVREKAEKKSLVEKLFYPWQIKIPVQIFATVFIAVIAVYIYRAGENQMTEVATSPAPSPVMEFQKKQLPDEKNKIAADEALQKKEQSEPIAERATPQKDATSQKVTGAMQQKEPTIQREERAIPQKDIMPERTAVTDSDRVKDINEEVVSGAKADKYKGASAARSMSMPKVAMEKKQESSASGASMKASPAPQDLSRIATPTILLRVADIDKAAGEVEKLLKKYEAKNIVRRTTQNKAILTAQLKNKKIKDLIVQLKTIGLIESGDISADSSANETAVLIEISGN